MNRTIMALLFFALIINPIIVTHVKSEINYEINLSVGKTVGAFIWLNETNIHQIWLNSNTTYIITVTPKDMQNSNISAINTNIRFSIWHLDGFEEELIVERKPSGDPEEWEYKSTRDGVYFINVSISNNADGYYFILVKEKFVIKPLHLIYAIVIVIVLVVALKSGTISRRINEWHSARKKEPKGAPVQVIVRTKWRIIKIGIVLLFYFILIGISIWFFHFESLIPLAILILGGAVNILYFLDLIGLLK